MLPLASCLSSYKRRTDSTQKNIKSSVYTFYCAQLEGEQTKHALHPDSSKRRPKKTPKIPRFDCHGWASVTISETNPGTTRVRLKHAFAHVSCFSTRDAGRGVGKSTLVPKIFAKELSEPGGSGSAAIQSADEVKGRENAHATASETSSSITTTALTGLSTSKAPRKRKRGQDALVMQDSSPALDPSTTPTQTESSNALASSSHDLSREYVSTFAMHNNVENHSQSFMVPSESSTHDSNVDFNPWPNDQSPGHIGHWGTFPPPPPVRVPTPPVPVAKEDRIFFPSTYLDQIRRQVEMAISEATKPGGLTLREARAFEAAFAPVSSLVAEIERAKDSGNRGL